MVYNFINYKQLNLFGIYIIRNHSLYYGLNNVNINLYEFLIRKTLIFITGIDRA